MNSEQVKRENDPVTGCRKHNCEAECLYSGLLHRKWAAADRWRLRFGLLLGVGLIGVGFLLYRLRWAEERNDSWGTTRQAFIRDAAMVGFPYRTLYPLLLECKGLNAGTAHCMRFDLNRNGVVDADDDRLWQAAAWKFWEDWLRIVDRSNDPAGMNFKYLMQADAYRPDVDP
jgi:hypothetical protein